MSEYNDGGLAERTGGSLSGGISQPGGPNTSSGSASNRSGGGGSTGGTYNDKSAGTNFGGIWGYGRPYGITGFTTPRRDQTLQDRMFENLGGGMVGTDIGGRYTGGGGSSGGTSGRAPMTPARRRQVAVINARRRAQGLPPIPNLYDYEYDPLASLSYPRPFSEEQMWGQWGYDDVAPWDPADYQHPGFPTGPWDNSYNWQTGNEAWGNQPWNGGYGTPPGSLGDTASWRGGLMNGGPLEPGGMAVVGEAGPELLTASPTGGAHVTPLTRPPGPQVSPGPVGPTPGARPVPQVSPGPIVQRPVPQVNPGPIVQRPMPPRIGAADLALRHAYNRAQRPIRPVPNRPRLGRPEMMALMRAGRRGAIV